MEDAFAMFLSNANCFISVQLDVAPLISCSPRISHGTCNSTEVKY